LVNPFYEISRINSVFKILIKSETQSLSEKVESQLSENHQYEDEPARKRLDRILNSKLDSSYKLKNDDISFLISESLSKYKNFPYQVCLYLKLQLWTLLCFQSEKCTCWLNRQDRQMMKIYTRGIDAIDGQLDVMELVQTNLNLKGVIHLFLNKKNRYMFKHRRDTILQADSEST
jgi:hypothetical protein